MCRPASFMHSRCQIQTLSMHSRSQLWSSLSRCRIIYVLTQEGRRSREKWMKRLANFLFFFFLILSFLFVNSTVTLLVGLIDWLVLHPFNGPISGTTWESQYQKGKTNLDLLEQDMVSGNGISLAICKSAPWPRHNYASIPPLSFVHAGCPSCCPTNSVKALKATPRYRFGRYSGIVVCRMKKVTLHWARLVLGWMIVVGRVYHLGM